MAFPQRLKTKRLVLRRLHSDDSDAYASIWRDPDVWAALIPGRPMDPEFGASRFTHQLEHWDRHGYGLFSVEMPETREIVGWAGPAHPDFAPDVAADVEVGWTFRRSHWGRGYATEAGATAIDACLSHLEIPRTISLINPDNRRSQKVATKLGLEIDGRVRATDGTPLDIWTQPSE